MGGARSISPSRAFEGSRFLDLSEARSRRYRRRFCKQIIILNSKYSFCNIFQALQDSLYTIQTISKFQHLYIFSNYSAISSKLERESIYFNDSSKFSQIFETTFSNQTLKRNFNNFDDNDITIAIFREFQRNLVELSEKFAANLRNNRLKTRTIFFANGNVCESGDLSQTPCNVRFVYCARGATAFVFFCFLNDGR